MRTSAFLLGAAMFVAAPAVAQDQPAQAPAAGQPGTGAADAGAAGQPGAASATPGKTAVAVGATVLDTSGATVGRITEVKGGNATVDTGTAKAAIATTSFAQGPNGLVLGMTKAQVESAAGAARPTEIAVGSAVVGPQGNPVGKVAEVKGDLVTVETPKAKVQLPKTAFAMNGSNLAIGMTQAQLEAEAAKAAPSSGAPSN